MGGRGSTLGRKVVTPNPPVSAVGGAQWGVRGHNFSTQWSHCFGFGPSRSLSQGSLSEFSPLSNIAQGPTRRISSVKMYSMGSIIPLACDNANEKTNIRKVVVLMCLQL